jgi:hypothetical protein
MEQVNGWTFRFRLDLAAAFTFCAFVAITCPLSGVIATQSALDRRSSSELIGDTVVGDDLPPLTSEDIDGIISGHAPVGEDRVARG